VLSCDWVILVSSPILDCPGVPISFSQLRCHLRRRRDRRRLAPSSRMTQEFPISAKRLPVTKRPGKRPLWNTLKLPFFNSLWRAFLLRVASATPPFVPACLGLLLRANHAPKPPHKARRFRPSAPPAIHTGESLPAINVPPPAPEGWSPQRKSPSPPA
jgi:hypothetical protein